MSFSFFLCGLMRALTLLNMYIVTQLQQNYVAYSKHWSYYLVLNCFHQGQWALTRGFFVARVLSHLQSSILWQMNQLVCRLLDHFQPIPFETRTPGFVCFLSVYVYANFSHPAAHNLPSARLTHHSSDSH